MPSEGLSPYHPCLVEIATLSASQLGFIPSIYAGSILPLPENCITNAMIGLWSNSYKGNIEDNVLNKITASIKKKADFV